MIGALMSLRPQPAGPIPEETIRVAHAAFPCGNIYMKMRDEFVLLYEDEDFLHLFPKVGQPAECPWRLALVTVMQFIEGLSDRQAAAAVRGRIDWKYLLALDLTDSGFDFSVLSEFRGRLIEGKAERLLLDRMLEKFKEQKLLKVRGSQRTDSTHILAAVRTLNRLESVGETMRAALNSLATVAPDWLAPHASSEWFDRYSRRVEEFRLPKGIEARTSYAEVIGSDGLRLLQLIDDEVAPAWLKEVEAVKTLRLMWEHQYEIRDGEARWRKAADLPKSGIRFDSPYDPEAHFGNKRTTTWTGYKVHLTETCDADMPHLITNVETTSAVVPDVAMTEAIQESLAGRNILPNKHIVDAGYVDGALIVSSKINQGVTIIGPVRGNTSWQAKQADGFDISLFKIDWRAKKVTCPNGKVTRKWAPTKDSWQNDIINVRFAKTDCLDCPLRHQCTRAKEGPRELTLRPQAEHETLQDIRNKQNTEEWKSQYDVRAGIEGTLSQGIRALGLRKCRYLGLAKTQLQHVFTAAGINVLRLGDWMAGVSPATTRRSRFAMLSPTN